MANNNTLNNNLLQQPPLPMAAAPQHQHDQYLQVPPAAGESQQPTCTYDNNGAPSLAHQQEAYAPSNLADHKVRISEAIRLTNRDERDSALISALRGVSAELEDAEEDLAHATKRVETARDLFEWATGALSGYSKTVEPSDGEVGLKIRRGRKRKGGQERHDEDEFDDRFIPPSDGPLLPPLAAAPVAGMTDEEITAHRDAFYQRLCGVSYSELISSYTPQANLANLKSRAQLDEWIYIATHWDTGVPAAEGIPGVEVSDFRRRNKSFYTKMKRSDENVGRRTGHHLREFNDGRKAFCRYGKNDESLIYISVDELYDAIYEIHTLTGHRGWNAAKKLANLKYANVTLDMIRCFVETCPLCLSTKKSSTRV